MINVSIVTLAPHCPSPSHLGSSLPAVGRSNHTVSPTWKLLCCTCWLYDLCRWCAASIMWGTTKFWSFDNLQLMVWRCITSITCWQRWCMNTASEHKFEGRCTHTSADWGVIWKHYLSNRRNFSQSASWHTYERSIYRSERLNCLTIPSPCGWQAIVLDLVISKHLVSVVTRYFQGFNPGPSAVSLAIHSWRKPSQVLY